MGIGNPGKEYLGTRHNVGFDTVDRLVARRGVEFKKERFWNALRARADVGGDEVTVLKPLSFVNLTGPVVAKVTRDLTVALEDVLLVVDDFWLPLGRLRIRRSGGDGGHNGLESVIRALATEEVARLRIGIGEPDPGRAVDHVLSRFREEEREVVLTTIETAADAVELWISEGVEPAMNRYNAVSEE
ncbi:MAG: aminoacyl-tRNA hydrolase [Planctomycetota bacterium]